MLPRSTGSVTAALKTWFARITRSRIAIAFLLFVLANYAAQITLHTVILAGYARSRDLVTGVIDAVGVQRGFTVFRENALEICSGIPTVQKTSCHTVYNGSSVSVPAIDLSVQCAKGLTWLETYFRDAMSEEVVYLVLESWLLVISFVSLIHESIPHTIIVLAAQVVNASWVSYRITRDISAKRIYDKVVVHGACEAFDILGGSWQLNTFYVTLGFSIAALLGMFVFVFKLVQLYSKETLSSVGSSPLIDRMLKWRLWMQVSLQLTSFFTLASAAVWFDKRKSNMSAPYSTNALYDVGFYVMSIVLMPWLALGIYSISMEKRLLFLVYALLSVVLLVISGLWFGSALFRYEYVTWRFFSCVTTTADILLVITCILSVICRVNFGKGLAHFLVVERELQASGFAPDVFLHGQGSSRQPRTGIKQVFTSNHPGPVSQPSASFSHSTLKVSRYAPSVCSVESTVLATWLPSKTSGDENRCRTVNEGLDRQASTKVIISRENVRPCSTHESSSGDETDEEQNVIPMEGSNSEGLASRIGHEANTCLQGGYEQTSFHII